MSAPRQSPPQDLEHAYRCWLRAYPRRWRAHREEEVLAVLVAGAHERGRVRPGAGEVLDLLAHGLDARLAWSLRAVPALVRQRTALLALTSGTLLSAAVLLVVEIALPQTLLGQLPAPRGNSVPGHLGPFASTGVLVYAAWLAAFATHLCGRAGTARLILAASIVLDAILVPVASWAHLARPPLFLLGVLAAFAVLAAAAPAPTSRSTRLWSTLVVLVLTVAVVALDGPARLGASSDARWFFDYRSGGLVFVTAFSPFVLVPGLLVAAAASLAGPPWMLSALAACVPWAYLWVLSHWDADTSRAVVPLAVLTAVVLTAAVTAASMSAVGIRLRIERPPA